MKKNLFPFYLLSLPLPITLGACESDDCDDSLTCPPPRFDASSEAGLEEDAAGRGGSGAGGAKDGSDAPGNGGVAGTEGVDAGPSDAAVAADVPPCNELASPTEEECLVSDEHAVFVFADAAEGGRGTKTSPLSSVQDGIDEAAKSDKRFVIVCAGRFEEAIVVDDENDDVRVHGGFTCPGATNPWHYDGTRRSIIAPSDPVPALVVDHTEDPVRFEDMEFRARDAEEPGQSSVAVTVEGASSVRFKSVRMIAGRGADGEAGQTEPFQFPMGHDGKDASGIAGGGSTRITCPLDKVSIGGLGGQGDATTPGSGAPGEPAYEEPGGEGGKGGAACDGDGIGRTGADAPPTGQTGAGAAKHGTLAGTQWTPAAGEDGIAGEPGQGGGGGGGGLETTDEGDNPIGGGGGGGAGGCGGAGGAAGKGGGASIALVVVDAVVRLDESELVSDEAGRGGQGAQGQAGQSGGEAGARTGNGCDGGRGGSGARGSAGGGGAGGLSVGILFRGESPELAETTVAFGDAGAGGEGGEPGENDGVDGVAMESFEMP